MNILLLSQFFSTTKGGGEYVFSLIAKSLAEQGHVVWVITNKVKNEVYPIQKNINFTFVPPLLEYKGGLPLGFYENITYVINTINKGLRVIKNERIDIIHSNNFSPALAGSILSALSRTPHITTVHDVFSLCGKNYWKLWGKQNNSSRVNVMLAPFFEKMIVKSKCAAIHTVSEATKEDLLQFGTKKPIYVIPNSIEVSNTIILEPIPLQFIYIGRLVFYKNLEVVIKAISLVKKTHPKILLRIVGDGPHRENLQKLVLDLSLEENIKFSGFVSNEEKLKLLATSQALVFPSLCEGFGLVILESFAQKKPVLVSNVRPLSDIVSDKITGFVIDPHDENKWAEKIIEIIDHPDKTKKMGEAGNEILKKKYNVKNMEKMILEMYNTVIKI
jgi:glycosyltransferase involved in cell wall biosynthesis